MTIDLHLHSTASDGHYSPGELVHLAARAGLRVVALTDHDSTEGVPAALEAARSITHFRVIPGVEIGTDVPHGEIHVLGYFIDYEGRRLNETLARLRESRVSRAMRMIAKLYNMGVDIEWRHVAELAGEGSVGRPHIARAMLEKGYVASLKEAFDRFIGRDGPAYVEREKMSPEEAVALIINAGGMAVLAHPATVPEVDSLVPRLKKAGLIGLEVYYGKTSPQDVARFKRLADNYELLATGGSDFHGINADFELPLGQVQVPERCVKDLIALATKLNCKHVF